MQNRLINLLDQADQICNNTRDCETCVGYGKGSMCRDFLYADHLIKAGVIVLPCKVGDSCYPLPTSKVPIVERKVSRITFSKRNIIIGYYENDGQYRPPLRTRTLGVDVFLSREEAEKAFNGGNI